MCKVAGKPHSCSHTHPVCFLHHSTPSGYRCKGNCTRQDLLEQEWRHLRWRRRTSIRRSTRHLQGCTQQLDKRINKDQLSSRRSLQSWLHHLAVLVLSYLRCSIPKTATRSHQDLFAVRRIHSRKGSMHWVLHKLPSHFPYMSCSNHLRAVDQLPRRGYCHNSIERNIRSRRR